MQPLTLGFSIVATKFKQWVRSNRSRINFMRCAFQTRVSEAYLLSMNSFAAFRRLHGSLLKWQLTKWVRAVVRFSCVYGIRLGLTGGCAIFFNLFVTWRMMRLQFRGTIALMAVADITSEASCANATFSSVSFAIFDVNSSLNFVISRSKIAFASCSCSAIFSANFACRCSANFCLSVNLVEYFLSGNLWQQKMQNKINFLMKKQARQQSYDKIN